MTVLSIPVSYHIMLLCCSVPCGLRKPKTSRAHATSQDGGATYLNTRSRFRYRMSLLSLPDELLLHLLKSLHIKDLLSMRSVSIDVTIHQCIAILGPAIRIYILVILVIRIAIPQAARHHMYRDARVLLPSGRTGRL